jgi:16S rRNA (cytosine967-C5)-methyltransferase
MPSPSNPRKFSCKVLQTIYRNQGFADDVFDAAIKEAVLTNQDRALAFEMVYGVLRHALTLDWRLDQISRKPLARLPLNVATILRVAAYQLLYLDRVPESAAVNEAVKLTRNQRRSRGSDRARLERAATCARRCCGRWASAR